MFSQGRPILFIDEAYGLNDGPGGFGKDAMPTLLTKLLDYKGRMICIAAGYPREIRQWVDTNSGLRSRFTKEIIFEDYERRPARADFPQPRRQGQSSL